MNKFLSSLLLSIYTVLTTQFAFSQGGTDGTEWFAKPKYGILVHFLYQLQNSNPQWNLNKVTSWDSCVNDFNVQSFARQLQYVGADYVIFSLQQRSRYFCIPNETFEKITGYKRGEATSHRDLINDLYNELQKRNIKLFLYIPGDGPYGDSLARTAFKYGFTKGGTLKISDDYLDKWSRIIKEISLRYKNKISGWWVDGCNPQTGYGNVQLQKLKEAILAGNPNAMVAFNAEYDKDPYMDSTVGNYTAGEEYNLTYRPSKDSSTINNKYWHVASFVGKSWTSAGIRFTDNYLTRYLNSCFDNGGSVTLGVAITRNGDIQKDQLGQLKRIQTALHR